MLNSVSSDRVRATHQEPQAQLRLRYARIRSSPEDGNPKMRLGTCCYMIPIQFVEPSTLRIE